MTLNLLLQIIIALIFIYLICSLVVSELQEQFTALLEFRARNLKKAIEIFVGKEMTNKMYENSLASFNQYTNTFLGIHLISNLFPSSDKQQSVGPSYIEPKVFAESLLIEINNLISDDNNKFLKNDAVDDVIKKINNILTTDTQKVCFNRLKQIANNTKLKYNSPTLDNFIDEIALTFSQIMERTSGVYKRNAKGVSLIFGLLIASLLNIDTFHIITELYKTPALTQEINQLATTAIKNNELCVTDANGDNKSKECFEKALTESKKIEGLTNPLPIGWDDKGWFNSEQINSQKGWLQAIIGWFITAIAISIGAPFWFDLLGKVINVRNTIKPISPDLNNQQESENKS